MPELGKTKKTETIATLNVQHLSVKFDKLVKAKIIGSAMASFGEDDEKPKLLLLINEQRFDFVLNVTNQELIGNILERLGKERDTDEIPENSEIELEVYDTGGDGKFQYGIRVNSLTFPK